MKKLVVVFVSLMLIQFFACAKTSDTFKPGQTIKIGFIGPMSGAESDYGKFPSQAVRLAVDEFNEQGGIHGFKIELVIGDSAGKAEIGVPAVEKLIKTDKIICLVGDIFSAVSLAIGPIAEDAKVVMISSSTHKDVTNKGKFIFRTIMSDSTQAIVFAKYLTTVENIKTAAILYVNTDYSKGLAMDFWGEFEKEGSSVVALEVAAPGTQDFKPHLRKILAKQPEILYLPNYITGIAPVIKQAKEIGLKAKIYSADSFSSTQIFDLVGNLANGVVFSQMAEVPENPTTQRFIAKYQEKWGEDPALFAVNVYDATCIILNAIKQKASKNIISGSLNIDRDVLRDFIAETKDFDGASGKITFTKNGDSVSNVGIFISEDRKFRQTRVYQLDGSDLVELK